MGSFIYGNVRDVVKVMSGNFCQELKKKRKGINSIVGKLGVRGSVHHATTHTAKNPTRCKSVSKFIISYLYEALHVSGDTPPIIRKLKLH